MTRAFIVSHTHWDREWYATRESFRVMLVSLVDRLLAILDSQPEFKAFMLDGQAIVLEDYCEVKPDNRDVLARHIASGRILVGPWYMLPDEFLVSGEAHIRNFLVGTRVCESFGASMRVGYLPDSFGHPSQMPQILAGLGLREMVFWRGLGPDITETELRWRGRDGTAIFGVNLPLSYGVAACLPDDPDAFVQRLREKIALLAPLTRTGCILLMQGVDHVAPSASLVRNIAYAREKLPDVELIHGSLPDYLAGVGAAHVDYQETAGELRSGCKAYLLGGTISTRMYLKQESYRAEILLERSLETMASIAWVTGAMPYPDAELRHAWKLHLENMPHDSICGCSVDEVHQEMMGRLRCLAEFGEALLEKLASAVGAGTFGGAATGGAASARGASAAHAHRGACDGRLLVLNTLGSTRTDVVETRVRTEERLLRKVNYQTGALDEYDPSAPGPAPSRILLSAADGTEIVGSLGSWTERDIMKLSEDTQPQMYRVREAAAWFVAPAVPALGYKVFEYRLLAGTEGPTPGTGHRGARGAAREIENEHLAAGWDAATATFTVRDKRTGRSFPGLLSFEDTGDAGDEYTYSAPLHDAAASFDPASVTVSVGGDGLRKLLIVKGSLRVPARLSEDRQSRSSQSLLMPVEAVAALCPGVPRVDLRIEVENEAEDHRLRLLFPAGFAASAASSEGAFAVDDRPLTVQDDSPYAGWIEPPSTHPQKSFVSVSDGNVGLTIANRGLPEYEVFDRDGAVIAVTLLRCVGWLSRPDLRARKGNGGWTIPTPGAQCPGRHVFELSIIPHAGDWDRGGGARAARDFNVPLRAFDCAPRAEALETAAVSAVGAAERAGSFSLFSVDREEIAVTAMKGSERGGSLILRCFNSSPREVSARFTAGFPIARAYAVSLSEDRRREITATEAGFSLELGPWKIQTVEIVAERRRGKGR